MNGQRRVAPFVTREIVSCLGCCDVFITHQKWVVCTLQVLVFDVYPILVGANDTAAKHGQDACAQRVKRCIEAAAWALSCSR
jgi:hypothetical protein